MTPDGTSDERDELLLPWHAAGTLEPRDAERIGRAIAAKDEISRQYRLTLAERAEVVHINEQLGGPSAGALERLLSRIELEASPAASRPTPSGVIGWIGDRLSRLGPQTLAWGAMAGALLILVQVGLLGAIYASRLGPTRYATASMPEAEIGVGFVPGTTIAEVTKFAETYHLVIVNGPLTGGMFKMRAEGEGKTKTALEQLVRRMQQESGIVRVAAVAE